MQNQNKIYLLHITIPLLIAFFSFFVVSDWVSSPDFTEGMIASVDESKEEVLKLAASSTAVSVAITALPGDLATPVAEALVKLDGGFMAILCVLYFERFLISIMGVISFRVLVPIACVVYMFGFIARKYPMIQLAYKMICFSVALFLVVPAGTGLSRLVRESYGDTIRQTIESAENSARQMGESIEGSKTGEETGNGLEQVLKSLQQSGDGIARGTSQFMTYLERLLSRMMDAIAIMIVTSCLIPLVAVWVLYQISKMLFSSVKSGVEPAASEGSPAERNGRQR